MAALATLCMVVAALTPNTAAQAYTQTLDPIFQGASASWDDTPCGRGGGAYGSVGSAIAALRAYTTGCQYSGAIYVDTCSAVPATTKTTGGCTLTAHKTAPYGDSLGGTAAWTFTCPAGTTQSGEVCSCPAGQQWVGSANACLNACPTGTRWVTEANACKPFADRYHDKPADSCQASYGNPIQPLTGAKRQDESLGIALGRTALSVSYDSRTKVPSSDQTPQLSVSAAPSFGSLWTSSLHRNLVFQSDGTGTLQTVQAGRGAGVWIAFTKSGGSYLPDVDVKDRLTSISGGWRYTDHTARAVETYNASGRLTSVAIAAGGSLAFTYSDGTTPANVAPVAGLLIQVQDQFARTLKFSYVLAPDGVTPRIVTVTGPDNMTTAVAYDSNGNLSILTWPDNAVRQFVYDAVGLPWALTGVIDESTKRLATYGYDGQGRATSTEHAGSTNRYSVTYTAPPQWVISEVYDAAAQVIWRDHNWQLVDTPVVTQPNGSTSTLSASLVQGMPRITSQSQPAGSGCDAATQTLAYDTNGNVTRRDNFNAQRACYAFDTSRNLRTVAVDGLANTVDCTTVTPPAAALPTGSRKTTSEWHPDWALKTREAGPRKITTWVYNGQPDPFNGNAVASCAPAGATLPDGKPIVVLCKQVEQATTDATGSTGFSATLGHGVAGNTSPATRTWAWTYNATGQVLTENGPRTDVSDITTYAYYADTTTDHTLGDLQTQSNALGQATTFNQYNKAGNLLKSTDANGTVTTYTYDARQRLKTRTVSAAGVASRITSYDYWPTGLLKTVNLPVGLASTAAGNGGQSFGRSYTYTYDDAHRLTDITSSTGEGVHYTLDATGNVTREEWINSTAQGGTASLVRRQFDALGRLWKEIRTINGTDATTEYGYDAQGNPTTTQQPMVAAYGETTAPKETRRYNSLNQLSQIEDALNGTAAPTTVTPRADDQLSGLAAPNAAGSTYQRDAWGQALQETSADRGTVNQTFDEAGNLKTRVDATGVTATWTYDALNRPTAVTYSKAGSTSESFTYGWDSSTGGITCSNGIGRLCKVVDNSGTTTLAYEPFGNLSQQRTVESSLTQNLAFGYDGEDRLSASTTSASRALALVRDSEGRVSQVLGIVAGTAAQVIKSSTYVADGRQDKTILGNSLVVDRDFDSTGQMTGVTEQTPVIQDTDVPTAPEWAMIILGALLIGQMLRGQWQRLLPALFVGVLAFSFGQAWAGETLQYDARGNITTRIVDTVTSTYQYDVLDRMESETGKVTQAFCYDGNGNRTCDLQASYTVSANSNRLATRAGVAITYDGAGNTLTDRAIMAGTLSSRTFTYWLSDQLKTVSIGGVLKATYTYNANRQRTRKVLTSPPTNTPGTTLYRYDPNGHLLEEIAGTAFTGSLGASIPAGTSLTTYVWKDEVPVAVIYAPGTASNSTATERIVYLEADHLNTPRKATDSTGKVVWTWESDAFGSSVPNEDPDADGKKTIINLRFPGQYFDAESGLHYNHHRFYDPQVGRYTQPDPLGLAAGLNPYAYVESRPLASSDPSGLCPICPLIALGLLAHEIANSDQFVPGGSGVKAAGKVANAVEECAAKGMFRGGAYGKLESIAGLEKHHMPANSVSPLSRGKGPSIQMDKADHALTSSYGSSAEAAAYRQGINDLLEGGRWRDAMAREIRDVRDAAGSKYNQAVQEMLDYARQQGLLTKP